MPSPRFQEYLNKFKERFRALHEETVYPYDDPIETLAVLLEVQLPEIAVDIINLFSKTKVFYSLERAKW